LYNYLKPLDSLQSKLIIIKYIITQREIQSEFNSIQHLQIYQISMNWSKWTVVKYTMTRTRIQNGSNPIRQPDCLDSYIYFRPLYPPDTTSHVDGNKGPNLSSTWPTQMHNCPNLWPNNHIHPLFFFFFCVLLLSNIHRIYITRKIINGP
jgi:hypothetical protein